MREKLASVYRLLATAYEMLAAAEEANDAEACEHTHMQIIRLEQVEKSIYETMRKFVEQQQRDRAFA